MKSTVLLLSFVGVLCSCAQQPLQPPYRQPNEAQPHAKLALRSNVTISAGASLFLERRQLYWAFHEEPCPGQWNEQNVVATYKSTADAEQVARLDADKRSFVASSTSFGGWVCFNTLSFVPVAGHSYAMHQTYERSSRTCQATILEQETGKEPDTLVRHLPRTACE